jgi:hypothetical protein
MPKRLPIIAAAFVGLALPGCASSPWPVNVPSTGGQSVARASAPFDPQRLQDAVAELQRLEAVDPAAHDQLLADLRGSDPSIWPLVIEQSRATQAYRRQSLSRRVGPGFVQRLPAPDGVVPAACSSEQAYPDTSAPPSDVVPASCTTPATGGAWRQRLNETIEALEAETPTTAITPVELAQHARLRMLYAAAGRREEAARPIPDASSATQEFFSKELQGLGAWLDADQAADPVRRAAEAKPTLIQALAKLGETGPLLVRNAIFCSEVLGFGSVKRFEKSEFTAEQEVLLYAEIENFVSESSPQGFHTSLRGNYQIVDSLGRPVVQRSFAATDDHCKSQRRDFFVVYRFRMPRQIEQGKYMLRLVVQDALSQKAGQASIEFTVKEKAESKMEKGIKSPVAPQHNSAV